MVLVGCAIPNRSITEKQALGALKNYFNAADVDNFDRKKIGLLLTGDFRIFEGGDFDQNQFFGDVQKLLSTKNIISTNWELSDFEVSLDKTSAHISYINEGTFVSLNSRSQKEMEKIKWLESVYILQDQNGEIRIKFMHAAEISRESKILSE